MYDAHHLSGAPAPCRYAAACRLRAIFAIRLTSLVANAHEASIAGCQACYRYFERLLLAAMLISIFCSHARAAAAYYTSSHTILMLRGRHIDISSISDR